jgi:hypothetical protein
MTKKSFIITVVLMLLIATTTSFAADKYQWKLESKGSDGCEIYTSVVAGKEYIAAKTTCIIPARMEVIGMLLRDIPNYSEWMEDCKDTKMLKVVDDQNDVFIFWFRQHIPVLTDRDMVIKSQVVTNYAKGQDNIYGDLTNEIKYDTGKGYVRMPSFNSLFTLEWVNRENTKVTFMVDPDLGPGIPSVAANPIIKTLPHKTLKRMMKMVKKHEYVDAAKTSKYNTAIEKAIKDGILK